ncbi:Uracil-DNA glycosylase [Sulfurimonas gotlandica GD1]|uniref:Uracil-DNA glycosylase n=1 Tax=Sulfurimonas gotlandica (strain DSM 19862 / JCM 16533 / GD1) TaxID=929558 RepID=B6BKA3_SULGG|nr:uracil-DNA glycosylase [Sulfurimonas gotlandica]EDZ62312.1 uracil-DNA glycosylase [Sulfurimonas gotlandica GD1]EHP28956.1 Uracil-DNA glycosylase [Sulfurimonas gotlandica GD1]
MILNNEWSALFASEMQKEYFIKLQEFVEAEYKAVTIFPEYENIFRAFNLVTPEQVKVVILGQDPYHGERQANGLAFSVCDECKIPPSLINIFKELVDDEGCKKPASGNLTSWAEQGVLLINSVLTVEQAKANSHKGRGWEKFSDFVIKKLSSEYENIVFILWGGPSQKKENLIDASTHLVLKAPHPSPLSSYRGFFGSKPFSKSNEYLKAHGKKEINWCLA